MAEDNFTTSPIPQPENLIVEAFCFDGVAGDDYVIPPYVTSDPLIASQNNGYPISQGTALDEGGVPVDRAETNGLHRIETETLAFLTNGGEFTFNEIVSQRKGGYKYGAILFDYASNSYVRSLRDSNTANFVTNPEFINDGVNWTVQGGNSAPTVTTLAATSIAGTSMILNADLVALGYEGIVSAGFQYRLAGSPTWINTTYVELDRFQTYNSPITGLTANTTYEFRAVAIGLDNPNNNAYGVILTATTQNITPSDYTINIVGTTPGALNDALNTTNVNTVINGAVNNDTALVVASANGCTAAIREYAQITGDPDFVAVNTLYQFAPLKLAIDAATTNTSVVVTSPISGLLSNGSPLWCDDGGIIKDVTAANVVETKTRGTPSAALTDGLSTILYCSFTDGDNTYAVSSTRTWSQQGQFYYTYLYITKVGVVGTYQTITYASSLVRIFTDAVVYEANDIKYLAALSPEGGGILVYKWDAVAQIFVRAEANDAPSPVSGAACICSVRIGNINYLFSSSWYTFNNVTTYSITKYTIAANGKLTQGTANTFYGINNFDQSLKSFNYQNDTYLVQGIQDTTYIYKYSNTSTPWELVQTIANRKYPVVTTDNDGTNYLATLVTNSAVFEIRKWDGTQFPASSAVLTDTINVPLASGSCSIVYQDAKSFGFGNYLVIGFVDINKYTCTGLSPALTGAPTWVAKGGQSFASSVTASSGAPNYVTDTVSTVTRSGDILIATTADRSVSGRYVRLRISLNLNDTASRYYAGFLV